MENTIIKWQTVNTRKNNKNLPEVGRKIVFKLHSSKYYHQFEKMGADPEQIVTSIVSVDEENLCVKYGYVTLPFENGFQWCYWEDVENI